MVGREKQTLMVFMLFLGQSRHGGAVLVRLNDQTKITQEAFFMAEIGNFARS